MPPAFSNAVMNISEAALPGFMLGTLTARPVGPRQRVLYYIYPEGNTATLFNRRQQPIGSTSGVFRIGTAI
jgi:hypothetical protein